MPSKGMVYVRRMFNDYYRATNENKMYGPVVAVTKEEFLKKYPPRHKLPKQWKNWCAQMNLYAANTEAEPHGMGPWMQLHGHDHFWRVDLKDNTLVLGDWIDTFNDWDSSPIEFAPMPTTLDEFRKTVKQLLELAQTKEAEHHQFSYQEPDEGEV